MADDPEITKPPITSNVISLPQNYVKHILTANETGAMDLLQYREVEKSRNWRETNNYKNKKQNTSHYSHCRGVCKCLSI